jgi:flagellar capping protein FliD
MKQALFLTENKFAELDKRLQELKREGIYADEDQKSLFNIQAEFRTLFHTVDVNLVKERTDGVTAKLDQLDKDIKAMSRELNFRKNFSAFLMLAFSGMGIIILVLSRGHDD